MLCHSPEETRKAGEALGMRLRGKAAVVALYGDVGAGKTVFVQGLACGLGITEPVTSPTYALVRAYPGLYHFDMYRLSGSDELFELGWEDFLGEGVVCAVEWSEIIADALPADTIHVKLSRVSHEENCRELEIAGGDAVL